MKKTFAKSHLLDYIQNMKALIHTTCITFAGVVSPVLYASQKKEVALWVFFIAFSLLLINLITLKKTK